MRRDAVACGWNIWAESVSAVARSSMTLHQRLCRWVFIIKTLRENETFYAIIIPPKMLGTQRLCKAWLDYEDTVIHNDTRSYSSSFSYTSEHFPPGRTWVGDSLWPSDRLSISVPQGLCITRKGRPKLFHQSKLKSKVLMCFSWYLDSESLWKKTSCIDIKTVKKPVSLPVPVIM